MDIINANRSGIANAHRVEDQDSSIIDADETDITNAGKTKYSSI